MAKCILGNRRWVRPPPHPGRASPDLQPRLGLDCLRRSRTAGEARGRRWRGPEHSLLRGLIVVSRPGKIVIEHQRKGDQRRVLLAVDHHTAGEQPSVELAAAVAAGMDAAVTVVAVDTHHLRPHLAAEPILAAAGSLDPSAVALAPSLYATFGQPAATSVTHEVIRRSGYPVLLLPIDCMKPPPGELWTARMILAIAEATPEPQRTAAVIRRIAEPGSAVWILHIHEVDRPEGTAPGYQIDSVVQSLQRVGFQTTVVRSHCLPHTIASDIVEVAGELNARMIVVGSGHPSWAPGIVRRSVVSDLIRRAPWPVLVER
jgi:nucleotide-binding universal stress UspA family protein